MTSRKLIYPILALLIATSLLTACGQKEAIKTGEAKTNLTVKNSKGQTNDQTRQDRQDSKAKTEGQTNQQSNTVETEADTATALVPSNNNNQSEPASATTLIPEAMLGTWTGVSPQAPDVSMTITAEGYVMTQATFSEIEGLRKNTAKITQVRDLGNNYYVIDSFTDDFSALTPGITGLGGIGKSAVGFYIIDNQLTPVSWFAALDQEIDYSKPQAFNFSLTRQ